MLGPRKRFEYRWGGFLILGSIALLDLFILRLKNHDLSPVMTLMSIILGIPALIMLIRSILTRPGVSSWLLEMSGVVIMAGLSVATIVVPLFVETRILPGWGLWIVLVGDVAFILFPLRHYKPRKKAA